MTITLYKKLVNERDEAREIAQARSFWKDHGVNMVRQALEMAEECATDANETAEGCATDAKLEIEELKRQLVTARERRDYWFGAYSTASALMLVTEKALSECGIGGIRSNFDGPADAITQMAQYIINQPMAQYIKERRDQLNK